MRLSTQLTLRHESFDTTDPKACVFSTQLTFPFTHRRAYIGNAALDETPLDAAGAASATPTPARDKQITSTETENETIRNYPQGNE